jgi:hypothetical protein
LERCSGPVADALRALGENILDGSVPPTSVSRFCDSLMGSRFEFSSLDEGEAGLRFGAGSDAFLFLSQLLVRFRAKP